MEDAKLSLVFGGRSLVKPLVSALIKPGFRHCLPKAPASGPLNGFIEGETLPCCKAHSFCSRMATVRAKLGSRAANTTGFSLPRISYERLPFRYAFEQVEVAFCKAS